MAIAIYQSNIALETYGLKHLLTLLQQKLTTYFVRQLIQTAFLYDSILQDEEISTAEVNKRKISAANSDEHYKNNTSQSIKSFQDESVVTDVNNQNLIDIRSDNNIIQVSDPSSEPASEYLTSAEKKEVGIDPVIKDTDTATCSTSSDVLPPEKVRSRAVLRAFP